MATELEQLMKADDVAELLQVTPAAIYQMKKRGQLKPVDLGLRSVRFRREDVQALIKGRKPRTKATAAA